MPAPKLLIGGSLAAFFLMHSAVSAADLSVGVRKAAVTHKHNVVRVRRSARVVADYDGTPVIFRPYRTVAMTRPDGMSWVRTEYAADWAQRATPRFYSNGEPVLPMYPRGWPRTATQRYRITAGLP